MSYFDPSTRRYETLRAGPFSLEVEGEEGTGAAGVLGGRARIRALATDLRFIHPAPGRLARTGSSRLWPWLLAALPLVLLPAIVLADRARQQYALSASGRRARIAREAAAHLTRARRLAEKDPAGAGREALLALHTWAESQIGSSARALGRAQLRRSLEDACGDPKRAEEAVRLIDAAEALRYAGAASSGDAQRLLEETLSLFEGGQPR